jgi:hypothetical protein
MTQADWAEFREMFEALSAAFRVRYITDRARDQALAQYFDVLSPYPISAVRRGWDKLRVAENFPKGPGTWLTAIPKSHGGDLVVMTPAEMRESDDAERRGYEGDPCQCRECREVGVTHQPIRYVPRLDASGELMKRRHPVSGYEKLLGEWIHGARLRTWWSARADFYQAFANLKLPAMPKATVADPRDERTLVQR